ncbi:hypothetical protein [Nonomuraea wenchangensis]|uniref:Uncharacterized protein n=1 Tax=Nonomuraea wenchangensis TaxID=568860 RepID=A0A1I0EXK1_9ACTN|nr:hypothetical protein [Nonomuraea wenchangensis]SET49417.1 hypothetical protein SAMN05421811_103218 [Nonomuraea wenchangensis]
MNLAVHAPSSSCEQTHCGAHDVDEPREGVFKVCLECGHAFATPSDLLAAYNSERRRMAEAELDGPDGTDYGTPALVPVTDVRQVEFCPCCAHDF